MERALRDLVDRWKSTQSVAPTWVYAISAAGRSILLIASIVLLATFISGPLLIAAMAAVCALVIVVPESLLAKRTRTLLDLSLSDPLTGIANRRALRTRLREELAKWSRGDYPVNLLMIDVDKLKQTNDSAGHRSGDELLCSVAKILSETTRVSDVVGRYGGDEFLVIAPQTTEEEAYSLAERIAQAARKVQLPFNGGGKLGLSIGVSSASTKNPDSKSLIQTADQAMFAAKRDGGDRVMSTAKRWTVNNVYPLRPSMK
jgi:diguanylate cyclase (GGDEF)-like protein